ITHRRFHERGPRTAPFDGTADRPGSMSSRLPGGFWLISAPNTISGPLRLLAVMPTALCPAGRSLRDGPVLRPLLPSVDGPQLHTPGGSGAVDRWLADRGRSHVCAQTMSLPGGPGR